VQETGPGEKYSEKNCGGELHVQGNFWPLGECEPYDCSVLDVVARPKGG